MHRVGTEMQRWCGLIEAEISSWPHVSARPMFGMAAFYRGVKIFAAIPRTRAAETETSLLLKLPGVDDERLKRASGPGAGWAAFELESDRDVAVAVQWLERAYRKAR